MYYNRKVSNDLAQLLENGGKLRWLFDFVKNHQELDFLIGKNNKTKGWISIYHGLTRILTIRLTDAFTVDISADKRYKSMSSDLFGIKNINENFQKSIEDLHAQIKYDKQFDRYFNNKKEGYFQNILSKKYGICGSVNDDFVIIDKEAVIGYSNQEEKFSLFGIIREKYKKLQIEISTHGAARYGKDLGKKAIGNELDFLALDKEGNILLIEYKHGTNTSGIYLSPLQIGLYYDIFSSFSRRELDNAVMEMLVQKQKIGLINPQWVRPVSFKEIIPVLIISEYNYKSSAKLKFDEILQFVRKRHGQSFLTNLKTYNYTIKSGLTKW